MRHQIIPLSQPDAWNQALSDMRHLPAHTWEYCLAMAESSHLDTALYWEAAGERKIICPFSVRSKEDGYREIVSPYGFGGVLSTEMLGDNAAPLGGWERFWRENGMVTAFIMQHPLCRISPDGREESIIESHALFCIDLTLSEEDLWRNMHSTHRYELRRDEKDNGLRIIIGAEELKHALFMLYPQTLERVQASKIYYFKQTTMEMLVNMQYALLVGAACDGAIQAVSLFLYTRHGAEYYLNAATPEGRKYSRTILWAAIKELKRRAVPFLNLGGGVRPGDSLEAFKRRFGGRPVRAQTLRQVFDQDKYAYLMKYRQASDAHDYFPPYWKENRDAQPAA